MAPQLFKSCCCCCICLGWKGRNVHLLQNPLLAGAVSELTRCSWFPLQQHQNILEVLCMCVSPGLRGFSLTLLVSVETVFPAGSHPL